MSSKLTELTEYSPSAPPPAVEVLDPACTECLAKFKDFFNTTIPNLQNAIFASLERNHVAVPGCCLLMQRDVARWTSVGGPIPVGGRPIYSSSEVPISRTNTEGVVKVVKRIRRIDDSPTDPDAEGSDELDGEEVQVVPHLVGHLSSNSSTQPLANRFQSQGIPSTPRTFQPMLDSIPTTIPPPSPSTSQVRPALNPAVSQLSVQQSRNSPITSSHQLQPVASSSRRRDGLSPLPFLPLKFFKEENVGLSGLPEKIPTRLVKNKKLWPDFSGGLIEIAER
ncbi:hypothetical protein O181_127244 [Austropuccinia psidii MF-1]|uniref:Uncharacterized protein n=1 Tax=Austropuccinia psidii MF-1 TaxID=1389203 RepID=A0A9Q3KXN4_9BASI|nr:hypothetical protein [Austropuccinia psidii MF-1]